MEIYLLREDTYERIMVLDEFESFIWTERQVDVGDFELKLLPSSQFSSIRIGRYISHSASRAIMEIEQILDETTSNGQRTVTLKGRGIESILKGRSVIPYPRREIWSYNGTTGEAIYFLVRNFLLSDTDISMGRDTIENAYIFNGTTDTEFIRFAIGIKSLFDAVKELCDTKNFSFGCDLRAEEPRLRFYVEEGIKRNIIFSTQLDTLSDPSFLESQIDHYNTAYIWSKDGRYRTAVGVPSIYKTGFDRRVLPIHASDLDLSDEIDTDILIAMMRQRGLEALGQHKKIKLFDGKLTGLESFVYRKHYSLGDIVTLMADDGTKRDVRVAEYTYSQDAMGVKEYPTFKESI